ncbi:MAG: folylpolyglutamate synthase/dihydrofolate synthase family protein [Vicingaceae bacterium]
MNYQETLDFLFQQLPMYQRQGKTAFKKDLTNTLALCETLGKPEQNFKSIHIAGTNGKGSVAHLLASIFQEAGYKAGLYTSPHLKDFRERIKVNGKMISETELVDFVKNNQAKFAGIKPSFFEWTVALAFHYFDRQKVDIAIIETGLGGRLDSTNVIKPELSIITNIGLDHTEILGDTLNQIAFEKAGIIKAQTPVIIGNSSGQKDIFESKAKAESAPIIYAEELLITPKLQSDLKGKYQKENLRTVYTAWWKLRQQGWMISFPQLQAGFKKVVQNTALQGRWQVLQTEPKIILDTAHNREGLVPVMKQLSTESYDTLHIVLGLVKEKKVKEILSLFPKQANYYFCQAHIPRAMNIDSLAQEAQKAGLKGKAYKTVYEAFEGAKRTASKTDLIFVGGSNFVVAEVL